MVIIHKNKSNQSIIIIDLKYYIHSVISMIKRQYHFKMNSKSSIQLMLIPREKRALMHIKWNRQFIAQIIDVKLGELCSAQLLHKQFRNASILSVSKLWALGHEKPSHDEQKHQ